MQAFTDLVGTSTLPTHGFDIAELTELTPKLDTASSVHDTSAEASEASLSLNISATGIGGFWCCLLID